MTRYVNKGKDVFPDPTVPGDGPIVMHPAMIVPEEGRPKINGAPVQETAPEFVVKKDKNAQD